MSYGTPTPPMRLLDVADGLRPDDGVPRPVTVKRED
jgi:hypothetical protein